VNLRLKSYDKSSQLKGRQCINEVIDVFDRYKAHYDPDGATHIKQSINFYEDMHSEGKFDPEHKYSLLRMPWSKFNIRHQYKSVKGFCGEIAVAGMWNSQNSNTRYILGRGNKEDEVNGIDLRVINDRWAGSYTSQAKVLKLTDRVKLRTEWFKYDELILHRFVMIDITNNMMIQIDYPSFKRYYQNKLNSREVSVSLDSIKQHVNKYMVLRGEL
jgi:hypothetical protein